MTTRLSRWLIGSLVGLVWLHAGPAGACAEPLRLPPGDNLAAPWKPVLTLDRPELKADEAAGFRIADDAQVGRVKPADTLPYVFRRLRRKDGICVGVFPGKNAREIAENVALTKKCTREATG